MGFRIHHVQLAVPAGSEETARQFYVDLLGMTEVAKPPALAARGGLWLRIDGAELHLGVEQEFRAAAKAHPALEVDDWEALRERLRTAGATPQDDALLPGRRRFYASDPFGNRLEFIDRGEA